MTNRIPGDERWRRELSELLTRIGTMILCRVSPLHEPPPHPFPLPIRWGEGGRRSGEGRFMVPMHAEKRKGAFHEPTHHWPLPGGELGKRARHWLPSSGGVGGGFMVSIHVRILEVFPTHEPRSSRREEAPTSFSR